LPCKFNYLASLFAANGASCNPIGMNSAMGRRLDLDSGVFAKAAVYADYR